MAAINPTIIAENINSCIDLKIIDTYTYPIPKSTFTDRKVTLTKVDGTETIIDFPYSNTDDTMQDSITIPNVFLQDYYLTIKVTYYYSNTTIEAKINYLSTCNAVSARSKFGKRILYLDNLDKQDFLHKILLLDNAIELAKDSATFTDSIKAQAFLDRAKYIIDDIENYK